MKSETVQRAKSKRGVFPVTFFKDWYATTNRRESMTFEEVGKLLRTTSADIKEALPWIKLATFGNERSKEGSLRHDGNVTGISGVEVDYDGEEIPFEDAVATIRESNLKAILYTTPSHKPEKPRWRILLPTSEVLPPHQRERLVARINGLFDGRLAGESFALSQSYYFGKVKGDSNYRVQLVDGGYEVLDGEFIDKCHDLDKSAIGRPAKGQKPAVDPRIDWAEVERLDGWCKSVDDLPEDFPAKGRDIISFNGGDVGKLNRLLAKTYKGHEPYDSWSHVTFALAYMAKQTDLSNEQIAALLRCDLPCNEHVTKEEQSNPKRAITRAIMRSHSELILSRASPLESAKKYATRAERPLIFNADEFYEWQGTHYQVLSDTDVNGRLYDFLDTARIKFTEGKGDAQVFKTKPFNPRREDVDQVKHALKTVINKSSTLSPPVWLKDGDAKKYIACENGLLRLDDGKLIDHTPNYFNTSALNFPYDPKAPEPKEFLKFLKSLFGDDREAAETLQEMFGYIISGDRNQQKIFLIVGPKRGGKGTLGHLLHKLVGDKSTGSKLLDLATRFGLQPLINKILAVMSDENVEGVIRSPHVSQHMLKVSGGDVVTVDRKLRDHWTGVLRVCFVILANKVPAFRDSTGALSSRFIVLKLTRSFYGREDKELLSKFEAELPGILNWAIGGWRRLQKRGHFVQPASGKDSVKLLSDMASPISSFVEERCRVGVGFKVPTQTLLEAYRKWAAINGHDADEVHIDGKVFGQNLRSVVSTVVNDKSGPRNNRVQHYFGIKLVKSVP